MMKRSQTNASLPDTNDQENNNTSNQSFKSSANKIPGCHSISLHISSISDQTVIVTVNDEFHPSSLQMRSTKVTKTIPLSQRRMTALNRWAMEHFTPLEVVLVNTLSIVH